MTIRATVGEWTAEWEGGRLADVFHESKPSAAVECIQIGEYDFSLPAHELEATRMHLSEEHVRAELREWIEEQGDCYIENVVRYS